MKAVFYSGILKDANLTTSDKLVYCQILYRSMWDDPSETFEKDGTFAIPDNLLQCAPISRFITASVCDCINIGRRQYFNSLKHLREVGLIDPPDEYSDTGSINIPDGLFNSEYFEIRTDTTLTGLSLIVYSYLWYKSKKYGWIDKNHEAMANELSMERTHLEHILSKLNKGGFIMFRYKNRQRLIHPAI